MKELVYLIAVEEDVLQVLQDERGCRLPGGECPAGCRREDFLAEHCLRELGYDVYIEDLICKSQADNTPICFYSGTVLEPLSQDRRLLSPLKLSDTDRLPPLHAAAVRECIAMMQAELLSEAEIEDY